MDMLNSPAEKEEMDKKINRIMPDRTKFDEENKTDVVSKIDDMKVKTFFLILGGHRE